MGDKIYESVRLYVPEFTGALFSSEGAERDTVFKLMNDGMSAVDAVRLVIANQKDDRNRWLDAIVYKLSQDARISELQFIEELKAAFVRSKNHAEKIPG
jgi:conjugal transfer ATP-binding protein TraC